MGDEKNNTGPKLGPRDVFLQLLAMVTLYMSAVAFGTLLFQYINLAFPDLLADGYYTEQAVRSSLRWAVSTLVVVFPVYVWVSWFLTREIGRDPDKSKLKTRKWLLNFTLFATAVVIIIDLVTLVLRYLEGEFTIRFALKVLTVLVIAGAIFFYYLWNLRTKGGAKNSKMQLLTRGVVILVSITVVLGFALAGSPQAERLRRFDERRVGDLQSIQWQTVTFWQQKNRLPQNLSELSDSISGYRAPTDPKTQEPYEYRVLGELDFTLCATFETDSSDTLTTLPPRIKRIPGPFELEENWVHGTGRTCFARSIDPERYENDAKPIPPPIR